MQGKRFAIEERVRWSDVDHAGIIYFGSYVRFFEIAETEMYREMGLPYSGAFDELDVYPCAGPKSIAIFKAPAFLDDLLTDQALGHASGQQLNELHSRLRERIP